MHDARGDPAEEDRLSGPRRRRRRSGWRRSAPRGKVFAGAPRASSRDSLVRFFFSTVRRPATILCGALLRLPGAPPSGRATPRAPHLEQLVRPFYAASTERAGDVLTTSAPRDPGAAGTPGRRLLGANGAPQGTPPSAPRAPPPRDDDPRRRARRRARPADTVPRVGAFNGLVGRGSAHREKAREAFRRRGRSAVVHEGTRRDTPPRAAGGSRSARRRDAPRRRREARRRRATRNARNARGPFRRGLDAGGPPNARSLVEPRGTRGSRDTRGVPSPHERRDSEKPSPGTGSEPSWEPARAPREPRGNPARMTT